jgi:hypothetical protein
LGVQGAWHLLLLLEIDYQNRNYVRAPVATVFRLEIDGAASGAFVLVHRELGHFRFRAFTCLRFLGQMKPIGRFGGILCPLLTGSVVCTPIMA